MRFETFVASRYLRGAEGGAESRGFLRFIIYVAIGGVALGVTTLVLALAIVHGFSEEIEAKIMGFGAHVQIESITNTPLQATGDLVQTASAIEGVTSAAPVVLEFALLRGGRDAVEGIQLWGTDSLPTYLADSITEGIAELNTDSGTSEGIVIGKPLAEQLGIVVGQQIAVVALDNPAVSTGFEIASFEVVGVYETLLADFDALYAFVDITAARELFDYASHESTRIDLMLSDPEDAYAVADQLDEAIGFPAMARTIFDVYRSLFAWVRLQESIIPVVLSIIALVAAFNVIGILLMLLLEKTRAIGLYKSLGASDRSVRRLFLRIGLGVGIIGSGIGVVLALLLAWIQIQFSVIPLPAEAYYLDQAPIALRALDVVVVVVVTTALCVLAAYLPARIAARIDPVRAIRFR